MPGQAPIVTDERDALRVFLDYHQGSYLAVAFGLSDEQARSKPTVSALSIGGLVKHAEDFLSLLRTTAPLRVAALGNQAGIVGAAIVAQRTTRRRPATGS